MISDSKNKWLLIVGLCLVLYGFFKPEFAPIVGPKPSVTDSVVLDEPTDEDLKNSCDEIIKAFKSGGPDRRVDGIRLASLYGDLARLISLDGDDQVIKSTLEIREANKLAGILGISGLNDKYKDLPKALTSTVVVGIGDDDIVLDSATREKAVATFKALSWACYEGSK